MIEIQMIEMIKRDDRDRDDRDGDDRGIQRIEIEKEIIEIEIIEIEIDRYSYRQNVFQGKYFFLQIIHNRESTYKNLVCEKNAKQYPPNIYLYKYFPPPGNIYPLLKQITNEQWENERSSRSDLLEISSRG